MLNANIEGDAIDIRAVANLRREHSVGMTGLRVSGNADEPACVLDSPQADPPIVKAASAAEQPNFSSEWLAAADGSSLVVRITMPRVQRASEVEIEAADGQLDVSSTITPPYALRLQLPAEADTSRLAAKFLKKSGVFVLTFASDALDPTQLPYSLPPAEAAHDDFEEADRHLKTAQQRRGLWITLRHVFLAQACHLFLQVGLKLRPTGSG